VACVGPDVLGGNQWGYMDTRCDPNAITQVQECQADNTWASSRACTGAKSCRMVNGSTCGTCLINGVATTCTETNLAAQQTCGPCLVGASTIANCRNSTIVSLTAATTMDTCETLFGNGTAVDGATPGTTLWGGIADCCDGMSAGGADGEFLLSGTTCVDSANGTPTVAGGFSDCCSLRVSAGVGAAFAYCAD
jgi:hypothetical protein